MKKVKLKNGEWSRSIKTLQRCTQIVDIEVVHFDAELCLRTLSARSHLTQFLNTLRVQANLVFNLGYTFILNLAESALKEVNTQMKC